jgi:glycosyltransferase involved in cell wall biosynthesis
MLARSIPTMIFVNDNTPSHTTMRGTARYVRKVVDGLIEYFGSQVVVYSPEARDYGAAKHIPAIRFRGIRRLGLHDRLASLVAAYYHPRVFYSTFFGKARTPAAEVFTVYDMSMELSVQQTPHVSLDVRRDIADKKHCLERADLLLAISESTAGDIRRLYPQVNPDKIVVTPIGVDDFFFQHPEAVIDRPAPSSRPYFLFVGYRGGHKNFMPLLAAFGQSWLANDYDLRVIAPEPPTPLEKDVVRTYGLQASLQFIAHVTDIGLRQNYAEATALVFPSTLEGFGLPIIEAMACGTLVATSNTSAMPEVGGDVALYFDPQQTDSIAECLRQIAALPSEERQHRIARGIARARTFTWKRCQQKTADAIHQLMGRLSHDPASPF